MHSNDRPSDRLFNDYCDVDAKWGPLLFLRPARHQRFGFRRTLAMSVMLGTLFGLAGNLALLVAAQTLHRPTASPLAFPAAPRAAYFLIASLTFAPAWNRRAARLTRRSRD